MAIKVLPVRMVEPEVRVILHTIAMTEFDRIEKNGEEFVTVAEEYIDIDAVLEDREFFSEPSIYKLESSNMDFNFSDKYINTKEPCNNASIFRLRVRPTPIHV